jgi:hypothetical protein
MFSPPVGLHEDAVNLVKADLSVTVPDGFEQGPDAEVAYAAQDAFGGAYDQCERVVGEGAVRKPAPVELLENEDFDIIGCEGLEVYGVGDAAAQILINAQAQLVDERWLGDEQ